MPTMFSQYRGRDRGVPAGFMQAASMPGQLIGAGIQQLAAGVSDGMTAADERHKQEAKLGKAAETFFEAIPEKERPMDMQAFKNLAATDKVAKMKGLVEAQAYRKGAEDIVTQLANRKALEANTRAVESSNKTRALQRDMQAEMTAKRDLFNADVQRRLEMPEGQLGPVKPLTPRELFDLSVKHGINEDPVRSLADVQQAEQAGVDITPRELSFGGNSWLFSPKPNTIQRNVRPDEGSLVPKALKDEAGNVLGHYIIDPESGKPIMLKQTDKPGAADVLKFEEGLRALDKDISDQEQLVEQKSKYANPDYLKQLRERRARLQMHYDREFGSQATQAAPGDGPAPAATSAPAASPGIRATWKNGKLVFPK